MAKNRFDKYYPYMLGSGLTHIGINFIMHYYVWEKKADLTQELFVILSMAWIALNVLALACIGWALRGKDLRTIEWIGYMTTYTIFLIAIGVLVYVQWLRRQIDIESNIAGIIFIVFGALILVLLWTKKMNLE